MTDTDAFRVALRPAEHLAEITLCRAESGNQLASSEIRALGQAIRTAGNREEVKVIVIRGEGQDFCLGRKPGAASGEKKTALDIRSGVVEPILDVYADVRATPVPVLAVVQGHARGFGCAFVGVCDLVIAADTARFSMPEMDNNLPPTLAISAVLGKVPPKRLVHFVYTRTQIIAAEALAWGLISEIAPFDQLKAALARILSRLVDRDRAALCAIKEYMNVAPYVDPAAAARLGANLLSAVLSSAKGG
jgi:enoyl-CoA hydratase